MPTYEIRVNILDLPIADQQGTIIPHTFIQITGSDGTITTVGFQPTTTSIFGPGQVIDNGDHPYDASSGQIQITEQQYRDLKAYVDRTRNAPPVYDIIGGSQCSTWVSNGLYEAGIISAVQAPMGMAFVDGLVTFSPYMDFVVMAGHGIVNIIADGALSLGGSGSSIPSSKYKIAPTTADAFNDAARWVQPIRYDPLTFDLNGNGIETVPINPSNPILFDHTGSGIKAGTGWIAPTDGFLVLDRNGNGTVDNGAELFGDSTPLASGGDAADGFAALATQDSNTDGAVNALDANFANLRIWQDLNQDGISFVDVNGNGILDAGETSELKTLAELNIASIKVAKTEHSQVLANGNEIADLGSFTRTDGSVGGMGVTSGLADVNLASDTFHRMFVDAIPLDPLAATLPDMQGSGVVRDLRNTKSTGVDFFFADMVRDPGEYRWSSYRWHGLGAGNDLITDHPLYTALGADEQGRRAAYRVLFRAHLDDEALDEIRKAASRGLPLGNDRFREQVEAALGRRVGLRPRGRHEAESSNAVLPGQMGLDL